MQQTILLQLSEHELKDIIKSSLSELIEENDQSSQKQTQRLFSLKEAAIYLHLAPQTLYGFTSQRTIPFIKKGKKLLFKKNEIDTWLNEGTKKTKYETEKSKIKKGGNYE
jgi:excisionase family DNA binding protein